MSHVEIFCVQLFNIFRSVQLLSCSGLVVGALVGTAALLTDVFVAVIVTDFIQMVKKCRRHFRVCQLNIDRVILETREKY